MGEVRPPYTSISGIVWLDSNNNGMRDAVSGTDEVAPEPVQVSLERYYFDADANKWVWDTQWADEYPAQYGDKYRPYNATASTASGAARNQMFPGVGKNWIDNNPATHNDWSFTPVDYANTMTDANGQFTFSNLKSSDMRVLTEGEEPVRVVYGYKLRISDEKFRSRNLLAANWRVDEAQPNYTIDSDLDYKTGYLMAEGEYAVLLNVADNEDYLNNANLNSDSIVNAKGESTKLRYVSQVSNLSDAAGTYANSYRAAGNSYNKAQNEKDIYGRKPAVSLVDGSTPVTAGMPANEMAADPFSVELLAANGAVVDVLTKASTLAGAYLADSYKATLDQAAKAAADGSDINPLLVYDLAKGANRRHSDAGFMEIPTQTISGYVWADADYDGIAHANNANEALVDYDDASTVRFSIDGTGYNEHGLVGKTVTLKQWYFVPANGNGDADKDSITGYAGGNGGQWILNTVTTVTGEGDDATATTSDAVFVTNTLAGDGANYSDGYYEFKNLPIYIAVDGVERLAGYTVEVLGGTQASAADNLANQLGDFNNVTTPEGFEAGAVNFPVTKIEAADALYASTARTVGTTLLGQAADAANNLADVTYNKFNAAGVLQPQRVYDEGNYPLLWNNLTGQAKKTDGSDELVGTADTSATLNTSNSTLDGMIILAGNVTAYTQDDNYQVVQRRAMVDASGNTVYGTVAFDMATGRSENRASAGYGYFGTSAIEGVVWRDGDFDGLLKTMGHGADQLLNNVTVELTQWYYLEGSLATNVDGAKVFTSNEVKANDGTVLRHSGTFAVNVKDTSVLPAVWVDDLENIEVVYGADGTTVVGAWIPQRQLRRQGIRRR